MTELSASDLKQMRTRLLSHARRALNNGQEAEDLVQQAFIAALEGRAPYTGEAPLVGWLMGILKHKIIDQMRRRSKDAALVVEGGWGLPSFDEFLEIRNVTGVQAGRTPDDCLEATRFFDALSEEVHKLSSNSARAFVLSDVEGASVEDVCDMLDVTPSNCGVLLHRARRKLRTALSVRGYGLDP